MALPNPVTVRPHPENIARGPNVAAILLAAEKLECLERDGGTKRTNRIELEI
jgi:hypothetical protein